MAASQMHPDRMRALDYWLGIPICFVLTRIARFGGFIGRSRRRDIQAVRNVLFVELAEAGSMVLAYSAVHQLRLSHPECRVFFLVFAHIAESVTVLNLAPEANVMTIDVSRLSTMIRDTVKVLVAARRARIDVAINLEAFTRVSMILSYLSGASTRVGFHRFAQEGLYTGDLLTHKVMYNPHLHTSQSFRTLVDALDESTAELPLGKRPAVLHETCVVPKRASEPEVRRRVLATLARENPRVIGKRLIAINPNASKLISIRKWPLDSYAQLVGRLLEDPQNACAITGVAEEGDEARYIAERVKNDRLVDLTGKTSLGELVELFSLAEILVTNDSGPAHLAALTNVHVVVFFGPETPMLYRPLTEACTVMYSHFACSPCVSAFNQRRSVCTNNRCLTAISVDAVYETVAGTLARRFEGVPDRESARQAVESPPLT